MISTLLFWTLLPYKRSNQLSFIRTQLCIVAEFFTSKSLYKHSVVRLTTHLQWAVDMFYLNFIVVFNQANRKLVSCQSSFCGPQARPTGKVLSSVWLGVGL